MPRLQTALEPEELRRLGVLWEVVRRTAPTRAHPVVSRRPPGNVFAALPLSAIDRTRDGLDHASRRTPPAVRRALRAASHRLAAAAHGVERLPAMRRGEPTATRTRDGAES